MGKKLSIDITKINSIAFVFYVDSIRSSKYSYIGIQYYYVIRYYFTDEISDIIEIIH